MGSKLKVAGWLAIGAVAGALTTMQLQATARSAMSPLPLEDMQQLAAVFDLVKRSYVEPVDEKKLIRDAIGGMVSGLDGEDGGVECLDPGDGGGVRIGRDVCI